MDAQLNSDDFQTPLMNPPSFFYGSNYDDLPNIIMPDMSQLWSTEGRYEVKRRKIARACDMCRKKKIKCDGFMPSCSHCIKYKTDCAYRLVEKKRTPSKGAKYVEALEKRLAKMELLLKASGLLPVDDNRQTDLSIVEEQPPEDLKKTPEKTASPSGSPIILSPQFFRGRTGSASQTTSNSTNSTETNYEMEENEVKISNDSEVDIEALSEMLGSLVTNNYGESRYIGSSSEFSILSPKGIQWMSERCDDFSLQKITSRLAKNKWVHWQPDMISDLFQRRVFQDLPPKNECLSLLKDYFEFFNGIFPLFHQPTFLHLVDRQYSRDPYNGSGWWASLNIALAIAHRYRSESSLNLREEEDMSRGYFKNATAVYAELTISNTDLLGVQALLGIAIFIWGTPNPCPAFFIVAAAIRSSHTIGLHKRGSGFNLNPVEIEQRKRVFWIAYLLEKDLCLRYGTPSVLDDDDISVDLPSANPDDDTGSILLLDGKTKVNFFRLTCELAIIESKVSKKLYSTKASKQSDGKLLQSIGELDRLLEEWKISIPVDIRPGHEIIALQPNLLLHIALFHLSYYNCLTTIHRMSIQQGYWTSRLSNYASQGLNSDSLNPRVLLSATICVSAARSSIELIKYVSQGDMHNAWFFPFYFASALVTLFGKILRNPNDPQARSDVQLMNRVVIFLSVLSKHEEYGDAKRLLAICSEFERVANAVLDKTEKTNSHRLKRKGPEDQSVNDNIPEDQSVNDNSPEDQSVNDNSQTYTSSASTPPDQCSSNFQEPFLDNELPPEIASNSQSLFNFTDSRILDPPKATGSQALDDPGSLLDEMIIPDNILQFINIHGIQPTPKNNFSQMLMPHDFWQVPVDPDGMEWLYHTDPYSYFDDNVPGNS